MESKTLGLEETHINNMDPKLIGAHKAHTTTNYTSMRYNNKQKPRFLETDPVDI